MWARQNILNLELRCMCVSPHLWARLEPKAIFVRNPNSFHLTLRVSVVLNWWNSSSYKVLTGIYGCPIVEGTLWLMMGVKVTINRTTNKKKKDCFIMSMTQTIGLLIYTPLLNGWNFTTNHVIRIVQYVIRGGLQATVHQWLFYFFYLLL